MTTVDKLYTACVLISCRIQSNIIPRFYDKYEPKRNESWRIISGNVTPFQKLFEGTKRYRNNKGILEIENREYIGPTDLDEDELEDAKLDLSNYGEPKFIRAEMSIRVSGRSKLGRNQIAVTFMGETVFLDDGDIVEFGTIENPGLHVIRA
jgi:hypothetical protein